jgi:copper(I)-binding protein
VLVSANSPIAAKAELHTHVMLGEVMKMQQVESVAIPAGGDVKFAPGGNHVMLFGLKKPLVAGEYFPLTLVFEKSGAVDVEVKVEQDAPAPSAEHMDH